MGQVQNRKLVTTSSEQSGMVLQGAWLLPYLALMSYGGYDIDALFIQNSANAHSSDCSLKK